MEAKEIFRVSVIIPVYNAEKYLHDAVESAVHLDEVGEIILVEDNSPDNALSICNELTKEYEKIKLFRHPGGVNKGAGASRNLGIKKVSFEYIAFLDADDLYLPNRFKAEKMIFQSRKEVEGVFNNTGRINSDNLYYGQNDIEKIEMLKVEDNLWNFIKGYFAIPTNSITLKKTLLEKAGYFNEKLKLHQDTHLWFKVFHFGYIVPGNLTEPVSLTREHENRRIHGRNVQSKILFLKAVLNDFKNYNGVDKRVMKAIINRYVYAKTPNKISAILQVVILFINNPKLLKYYF